MLSYPQYISISLHIQFTLLFLLRTGDDVDVCKWYDLFNRKNDKDVRDICNTLVSKIYLPPPFSGSEG